MRIVIEGTDRRALNRALRKELRRGQKYVKVRRKMNKLQRKLDRIY